MAHGDGSVAGGKYVATLLAMYLCRDTVKLEIFEE